MEKLPQVITHNHLIVLTMPRYRLQDLFVLMVNVALQNNVRVVDGGNVFNVLTLSRAIRRKTDQVNEVLKRFYISRAFTCFQMEAMLQNINEYHCPVFVLDLLYTFYDESVDGTQSHRLLTKSIHHLQQISATNPVVISLFPPAKGNRRPFLLDMILASADTLWQKEVDLKALKQLELWE